MVREEPTNTRTAGIDTNHSLNYVYVATRTQRHVWTTVDIVRILQYSQQSFAIDGKKYTTIFLWQNIHYLPVSSFVYTRPFSKSVK